MLEGRSRAHSIASRGVAQDRTTRGAKTCVTKTAGRTREVPKTLILPLEDWGWNQKVTHACYLQWENKQKSVIILQNGRFFSNKRGKDPASAPQAYLAHESQWVTCLEHSGDPCTDRG